MPGECNGYSCNAIIATKCVISMRFFYTAKLIPRKRFQILAECLTHRITQTIMGPV